jgi:hypothetical protein
MTTLREGMLAGFLANLAASWPGVSRGSYPLLERGHWRLRLVLPAEDEDLLDRAKKALIAPVENLERAPGNRDRSS